jgi:hypothetical protein
MLELLIDLVAARLSNSRVPVQLLHTLAIVFNHDTVFQRKHRTKSYDPTLYIKQLGERTLANPSLNSSFRIHHQHDSYGWLCELINRFVSKNGIIHLKEQFQHGTSLTLTVRRTTMSIIV